MFPGHMLGRKVVFSARIQATGQESCSTLPSKSIPQGKRKVILVAYFKLAWAENFMYYTR